METNVSPLRAYVVAYDPLILPLAAIRKYCRVNYN